MSGLRAFTSDETRLILEVQRLQAALDTSNVQRDHNAVLYREERANRKALEKINAGLLKTISAISAPSKKMAKKIEKVKKQKKAMKKVAGESKTAKNPKKQNTTTKKEKIKQIQKLHLKNKEMSGNTVPIPNPVSENSKMADIDKELAKQKKIQKICESVKKHQKKMEKQGVCQTYDIGQIISVNGMKIGKINEWLKKDLPKNTRRDLPKTNILNSLREH